MRSTILLSSSSLEILFLVTLAVRATASLASFD